MTKMVEDGKNIDKIIKGLPSMKGIDEQYIPKFKFIQIKKSQIKSLEGKVNRSMLCFNDISQKILYDTTKAEGEFLSLINSTISHEMRNPLNSIINQCKIIFSIC
jgi:signal transduction histidine kinase